MANKSDWHALYNTARWRNFRLAFLREHPLCERCLFSEIITEATVVHHKIAHRGDLTLFWDWGNLESLCKAHHDSHGQLEDHGKRTILFDPNGWPIYASEEAPR